ncbi:MAG: hypothetical protein HYZ45_12430 [Burkholderiales bacterium]|nr:hypothetical protein [Burkholderiales bacterium]
MDANTRFGFFPAPHNLRIRLGRRELSVRRDFRKRFYSVNPLLDCGAGIERGHLEILVLRRWLLVLGKAH